MYAQLKPIISARASTSQPTIPKNLWIHLEENTTIHIQIQLNFYRFGTGTRWHVMDEDDIEPGPGKYNSKSYTCTAPAYLFKKPLEE